MQIIYGITADQIKEVALSTRNKREAARKLGIHRRTLQKAVNGTELDQYFNAIRVGRPGRVPKLKREDLLSVQGMILRDAAKCLKMSYSAVRQSIIREGLRHLFPNKAEGMWISRRGYVG